MENIGNGRVIEFCDVCRQADDHPRHVVLTAEGTIQKRHLDCCAPSGCHDGSCNVIIEHAGEKRGADLLAHIQQHSDAIKELVTSGN